MFWLLIVLLALMLVVLIGIYQKLDAVTWLLGQIQGSLDGIEDRNHSDD